MASAHDVALLGHRDSLVSGTCTGLSDHYPVLALHVHCTPYMHHIQSIVRRSLRRSGLHLYRSVLRRVLSQPGGRPPGALYGTGSILIQFERCMCIVHCTLCSVQCASCIVQRHHMLGPPLPRCPVQWARRGRASFQLGVDRRRAVGPLAAGRRAVGPLGARLGRAGLGAKPALLRGRSRGRYARSGFRRAGRRACPAAGPRSRSRPRLRSSGPEDKGEWLVRNGTYIPGPELCHYVVHTGALERAAQWRRSV